MADLDDFFAKKDRKKSKGKKFTTTEEIAKKLEETGKRNERSKPKEKLTNPEGEDSQPVDDEEEWKDFEEEKKDYTGLKIGNLAVTEAADQDSDDDRGTGENSSDGEMGEAGTKHSGPWKKTEQAPAKEETTSTPAQPQPQAQSTNTTGSYKAPHLRNVRAMPTRSTRSNIAPDINNEKFFPTLNSKQPAANDSNAWGRRKKDEGTFEEVRNRGGNRYVMSETQSQGPKLSLVNKYGALPQDQS